MIDDTRTLERIGARIAEELGESLSEERRAAQRRTFLAAALTAMDAAPTSTWPRRAAIGITAAAAVALFAIAATTFFPQRAKPLSFWVGDHRVAGSEGTWIESPHSNALPIVFENGSRIDLKADTAVRVVISNTERVAVDVSGGELFADIKRNEGTKWEVNAGPYQVAVLGTAFTVDWDSKSSALAVAVSRGVVHVRGGHLSEYGIRIPAGKRLVAGGSDDRVALESIASMNEIPSRAWTSAAPTRGADLEDAESSEALPLEAPEATVPDSARSTRTASMRDFRGRDKSAEAWKSFYEKRDYAAAVAAAETAGIDALLNRLDLEDLWRLANASRFAHRGDVARRTLLAVRARFAESPRASTAAFLLGRGELEDRGHAEIARGWFETYLREASDGPLAEEALGRLMEACDKAGSAGDARRYAERYLSRYQDGLFAALAKTILTR